MRIIDLDEGRERLFCSDVERLQVAICITSAQIKNVINDIRSVSTKTAGEIAAKIFNLKE